jgi:hypothetical protein
MFDPRFKSLRVVENYVGLGACIYLVAEEDVNAIIPLLMIMFEVLNPIITRRKRPICDHCIYNYL